MATGAVPAGATLLAEDDAGAAWAAVWVATSTGPEGQLARPWILANCPYTRLRTVSDGARTEALLRGVVAD